MEFGGKGQAPLERPDFIPRFAVLVRGVDAANPQQIGLRIPVCLPRPGTDCIALHCEGLLGVLRRGSGRLWIHVCLLYVTICICMCMCIHVYTYTTSSKLSPKNHNVKTTRPSPPGRASLFYFLYPSQPHHIDSPCEPEFRCREQPAWRSTKRINHLYPPFLVQHKRPPEQVLSLGHAGPVFRATMAYKEARISKGKKVAE